MISVFTGKRAEVRGRRFAASPIAASILAALTFVVPIAAPRAQPTVPATQSASAELPVSRVALFSSGVGYFEHRGRISGDATVSLPFRASDVNDALKSLVVRDDASAGGSPSVSYPSQESLDRALKGFRVDLSGSPGMAEMLSKLRGAEVSIDMPETVTGKIVGVESRPRRVAGSPAGGPSPAANEPWLLLATGGGIRSFALYDIAALRFGDAKITEDVDKALALVLGAQDRLRRVLDVRLPGSGEREAALGYVIAAPVWKVSYRLDLSGDKPWLQGWAIIENPTDQDWKGVGLSLVSGRPVSFIQDLYTPLYVDRPVIPLAIAGIASARSFESGFAIDDLEDFLSDKDAQGPSTAPKAKGFAGGAPAPSQMPSARLMAKSDTAAPGPGAGLSRGGVDTAQARAAGDQFEFAVKRPVFLARRTSSMIPLVAGEIAAEKVSVYSPDSASRHPMLGARLTNSTAMKLPAGPITVFDGGVYAGDALLDFFPEREKRLIVFGEDLSVIGEASISSSQEIAAVTVTKGVMTFVRRVTWTRSYSFKNSGAAAKRIVVEHPIAQNAELSEPKTFDEKTAKVYRFGLALGAGAETKFVVREKAPARENITLASLSNDSFLYYSSSQDVPPNVRDALKKAIELKKKAEDAKRSLADLQARKNDRASDQGRIRQNLEAVGRDSSQGQQYLKRLMDAETEIDSLSTRIADAKQASQEAQAAYESWLANLMLN